MQQSQSFNEALEYARDFAINNNQNIIDISTIAIGILNTDSPFSEIFSDEERNKLTEELAKKTEGLGHHPLETETVPFTVNAGLLIRFASQYALEVGDGEIDVYHVMLALFSYQNEVATIFSRQGWIFDNYLEALNKIVNPPIEVDKMELDLQPSVTEPYSKLRKKFWAEDYKRGIAEKLTEEANRHATFGKYGSCRQLCDVVLDINPDSMDAYRLIIYSLCNEKDYQQAIDLYDTWGIDDDTMRMNTGICYRETGQHEKALEIFRSFPEVTAELHNIMGYSLCSLGRYEDAIKEYDEALTMNPEYSFAWNNKGYALLKSGHVQEAKNCIQQSLILDKGNSFAYRNLALVNIEEGNKEEALANIDKALFYGYREKFGDDINIITERANGIV